MQITTMSRSLNPAARACGALLLLSAINPSRALNAQSVTYPATYRDSTIDNYHGTIVADPYRWLEQTGDPRTADWLTAERKLTSGYLRTLGNRESIRRRLASLWAHARTEVPWREAGRLFYAANTA